MKVRSKLVLASMVFATSCGAPHKAQRSQMSAKEIVTVSKPAIVRVEVGSDRIGTGFVLDETGLVVTNLHVVVPSDDIVVRMLDGTTHSVKRVIGWDGPHDLVILDIDPPKALPVLTIGDSDTMSPGDSVLTIGNPLGVLDYSVSDGMLSAVRPLGPDVSLFQITAPISQGSSGGPVFNGYGEVVGVITAYLGGGQNLNFAVPSKYVLALAAAKKQPVTVSEFNAEMVKLSAGSQEDSAADPSDPPIVRRVPTHEISVLDGCSKDALVEVAEAISSAIELGAPLYNDGNYKACVMVYEGVSIKYSTMSSCAGVRSALEDGLRRAGTMNTAKAKAWALRDAFDGLVDTRSDGVILRKLRSMP